MSGKITNPMRITVLDAQLRDGVVSDLLYPAGQMRLIKQGLVDRDLVDVDEVGLCVLTDAGWKVR